MPTYIDKLLLALLLRASSLIFEDYIIVPPAIDIECLRIEQRVAVSNFLLTTLLFFRSLLGFLHNDQSASSRISGVGACVSPLSLWLLLFLA